ncbi:hypothetical protein MKX01_032372 [Papaver californicum]|nr:hypothetical protein MKX01_032372 [Papaver californicum]
MALELLMVDYGDSEEEEEEEESSLLAEAEQQGNMLEIVVFKESTALEEVPEEITNEIEERKTISVEFAMQRELDYCKKIEEMKNELPGYDYGELSMPVQGEPSNLELWEIDRKTPSDSFSNTHGEMSDLIKEEIRDEMDIAEMTNEIVKGNTMPVERAIQREFAYHKKIEGMQFQLRHDYVELPVADQEPHSIRKPSEMNTIPRSDKFPCFKDQATTEKVMWKTMSVELALQKEIEYQAKIKRLKVQAGNDFGKAPKPTIQGTSDLELRKMDRESCFENSSSLQGRIPNPIFFRGEVQRERSQQEITRREMSNERDRTTTMQNSQSGFKFQERPILSQGPTPDQKIAKVMEMAPFTNLAYPLPRKVKQQYNQKNPLFCKDCEVLCSGVKALKMDLRELVCEVCLVPCTDADSLRRHLSGKEHAAHVEKFAEAKAVRR